MKRIMEKIWFYIFMKLFSSIPEENVNFVYGFVLT